MKSILKYVNFALLGGIMVLGLIKCTSPQQPSDTKQAGGAVTWPGESLPCDEECEVIWPTEEDDFEFNEDVPPELTENIPTKTEKPVTEAKPQVVAAKPAQNTPNVSAPVAKAEPQYSTYAEYEVTVLNTCPSQRKANEWENGERLAAIGIKTSWLASFTYLDNISSSFNLSAEFYALNAWDYYDRGNYQSTTSYMPLFYVGYPKDDRYYRTQFIYHLDTLTVEVSGPMSNDITVQDHRAKIESFLKDTASKYHNKCPND